jgi:3-dehydroquinate synthase
MERRSPILALGGGVIGDLTGFVAATFLRGVPFLQIPTTLMAQVDSSVGGKVAVNHPRGKNLIGCFYQPRLVFMELDFLSTLASQEFASGLAEVVKCGLIADRSFFEYLERNRLSVRHREPAAIRQVVKRCCEIKSKIVEKDEKEEIGLRTILNYGHTLGHALETVTSYRTYLHGESVALGIVFASRLSLRLGLLNEKEQERVISLLQDFVLPVQLPKIEVDSLLKAMEYDKKVVSGKIQFVLTKGIGHAIISTEISLDLIRELLSDIKRS